MFDFNLTQICTNDRLSLMNAHCPKCSPGNREIVQLLIDNGANINAISSKNETALDKATQASNEGKF